MKTKKIRIASMGDTYCVTHWANNNIPFHNSYQFEVNLQTLARWSKIIDQYYKVQGEMRKLYEAKKDEAIKKCLTFDPKKVTTIPANPKARLRDGMVVDFVVKK